MADAKVEGTEVQASTIGLDLYMVKGQFTGDGTSALTIESGLRKIVQAQATWADSDVTGGVLFVTASDGTLTIKSPTDCGATDPYVWILAFGYRG